MPVISPKYGECINFYTKNHFLTSIKAFARVFRIVPKKEEDKLVRSIFGCVLSIFCF